jgi:hypothetical protein
MRSLCSLRSALALTLGVGAGCNRASAADAGAAPAAAAEIAVTLMGTPVKVTLPKDFRRTKDSDESLGVVGFNRDRDHPLAAVPERVMVMELASTPQVRVPPSLDEAEVVARADFCQGDTTKCAILTRETLPGGGYLITLKDYHAVTVEVLRPAPGGKAFLCEAYVANLLADGTAKTWLDDAAEVKRARLGVEAICRSAHAG